MFRYSSSVISLSFGVSTFLLLGLQLLEQRIEAPEGVFPNLAVAFQPLVGFCERPGLELPRPSLRVAAARNEACALQDLQVFGDRRLAHREWSGQLRYRRLAGGEPGQDRPPRGIGERRERRVEPGGGQMFITHWLHNRVVIYNDGASAVKRRKISDVPRFQSSPTGSRLLEHSCTGSCVTVRLLTGMNRGTAANRRFLHGSALACHVFAMFSLSVVEHLRLNFGVVVQNYTAHARAGDRLAATALKAKMAMLALLALATGSIVLSLFRPGREYQIAAGVIAGAAFAVHAMMVAYGVDARVHSH